MNGSGEMCREVMSPVLQSLDPSGDPRLRPSRYQSPVVRLLAAGTRAQQGSKQKHSHLHPPVLRHESPDGRQKNTAEVSDGEGV